MSVISLNVFPKGFVTIILQQLLSSHIDQFVIIMQLYLVDAAFSG